MLRTMCKSKLHGARVTEANVHYMGSLTVDAQLMRAADLVPYEQVHVVDVDNGARIVTYCIEGPAGSGMVCVNGAAARLILAGHNVIVISYAQFTPEELEGLSPKIVMLDERNRVRQVLTPSLACQPELA
ncbi:MAG: aspartate 1-decarboxylase [Candidatus Omnitrophica bacterium]|nr:aspartate 1-decarboxylase [Candidatus Omnitrophota bacterium]